MAARGTLKQTTPRQRGSFSQVFLHDQAVIQQIVAATLAHTPPATVLEIGCGSGNLTLPLVEAMPQGSRFFGVEVDPRMATALEPNLYAIARHHDVDATLLRQNVLGLQWQHFVTMHHLDQLSVVGNLPYHMTGSILFHLAGELDDAHHPLRGHLKQAILMVQKEVAQRLVATPGTEGYSALSLMMANYFTVDWVCQVPKTAYRPVPKVDSAVVRLLPREAPQLPVEDATAVRKLIKGAFAYRRKTLVNALTAAGYPAEALKNACVQADIQPGIRPERLDLLDFHRLSLALRQVEPAQ